MINEFSSEVIVRLRHYVFRLVDLRNGQTFKANKYSYVLAVRYGIDVDFYQINEGGWKQIENSKRSYFDGVEVPEEIKKYLLIKKS